YFEWVTVAENLRVGVCSRHFFNSSRFRATGVLPISAKITNVRRREDTPQRHRGHREKRFCLRGKELWFIACGHTGSPPTALRDLCVSVVNSFLGSLFKRAQHGLTERARELS